MIIITSFIILLIFYFFINYCLFSFGLFRMAQKRGIKKPGLAWIPVYNLYMLGLVAGDNIDVFGKRIYNLSTIYLISGMLSSWVTIRSHMKPNGLIAILFIVIHFLTLKKIFEDFSVSNPVLLSIVAILFSFTLPMIIFAVSFNEHNKNTIILEQ